MPLYNDKDCLLDAMISDVKTEIYKQGEKLKGLKIEKAGIEKRQKEVVETLYNLKRQKTILEQIFKDYNKK